MQVSWRSLIALALLPFAFLTIAHAQDANDPTVYMVTYLDVTPASRAAITLWYMSSVQYSSCPTESQSLQRSRPSRSAWVSALPM